MFRASHLTAFYTYQTQNSKTQHETGYRTEDYIEKTKPFAECSFCGSSHRASDGLKCTNVKDRLEVAKRKGLCFNCLKNTKMDRFLHLNKNTTQHFLRIGEKHFQHRRKEDTAKYNRNTIRLHLLHSERDPKDIYGNGTKWNQNRESSTSTGRRKLRHHLRNQPSAEPSATYNITLTT